MPVIWPSESERNFTPNSTAAVSGSAGVAGTAVAGQMVKVVCATIVMVKSFVAICWGLLASIALTVKRKVPEAVGVPEMTPVPLLSDKPVGSDPLVIDHVYGEVPPLAPNVVE